MAVWICIWLSGLVFGSLDLYLRVWTCILGVIPTPRGLCVLVGQFFFPNIARIMRRAEYQCLLGPLGDISDTEPQGSHYYCRTCLDEEFICGGPQGCEQKYKRRDRQFDWSHLKELKDPNKKRKKVFCAKCRESKEAKQTQ